MGKALDLAGQRFGRLTVIEKTHNDKGKLQWHCMCDCGGESFVESNRLLKGITTSCGCLRKERWREAQDKISAEAKNKIKYDIIGKRFDKLTVLLILGRIPPLLSEAKVGDECRLFFFTETIDNQ